MSVVYRICSEPQPNSLSRLRGRAGVGALATSSVLAAEDHPPLEGEGEEGAGAMAFETLDAIALPVWVRDARGVTVRERLL